MTSPASAPVSVTSRDLYSEAEARLGRRLTAGERRIDLLAADRTLEDAKERLQEAIEREKRRVLRRLLDRSEFPNVEETDEMLRILNGLHDAGRAAAKAELRALGIETDRRELAAREIPRLAWLRDALGALRTRMSLRIEREVVATDLGGLGAAAAVRALDRRVPGARDMASRLVSGAFNAGLGATFETYSDLVDSWVYSAVMDANACDVCRVYDGERYPTWADIQRVLPNGGPNPACYGNGRCRCRPVPEGPAMPETVAA